MSRTPKMLQFVNYRMRVQVSDTDRALVGTFLAYDKHMNLVLSDCQEYRKLKRKRGSADLEEREEMRKLGLVLLRGETVVSIQVEAPPKKKMKSAETGAKGVAVGRGDGVVASAPPVMGMVPGMMMPPQMMPHAHGMVPGGMMMTHTPPPLMGGMPPPMAGRGRGMPMGR